MRASMLGSPFQVVPDYNDFRSYSKMSGLNYVYVCPTCKLMLTRKAVETKGR